VVVGVVGPVNPVDPRDHMRQRVGKGEWRGPLPRRWIAMGARSAVHALQFIENSRFFARQGRNRQEDMTTASPRLVHGGSFSS